MIQTGLRISETLDEKIQKIATNLDVSKNTAVKILIGLGLNVYESTIHQGELFRDAFHNPE